MSLCLDNPLHLPFPGSQPSPSDSSLGLDLDLDLEAFDFDHLAEDSASSSSASSVVNAFNHPTTPQSSIILSPRSSLVEFSPTEEPTAIDALSKHHFERYLYYKALAAQAEVDARTALYSLFDPLSMENDNHQPNLNRNNTNNILLNANANTSMISIQAPQTQFFGEQDWAQSFAYQPQPVPMHQVYHTQANAQAQAQIHLQAHETARAAAIQQQQQQRSMSMTNFYMPPTNRSSIDAGPTLWSRQGSVSTNAASPQFPSTPSYVPVISTNSLPTFTSLPNTCTAPFVQAEGENELELEAEDDELEPEDNRPSIPSGALTNLHGGGRGYVPGKTPDDPKKRHKCTVCGRGFARAFNLKSHITTHDPLRPKPHQCPHPTCKRGFSRLHDLERHRQGIHSDGPLVDAKRQGVSPSVIRAQSRIQRRAESGRLI